MSIKVIVCPLLPDKRRSKQHVFCVNCFRDKLSLSPHDSNNDNILCGSQVTVYLGNEGLLLNIPLMYILKMFFCFSDLSHKLRDIIALLATFMALYPSPLSKSKVRKDIISPTVGAQGSTPLPPQN